MWRFIRNQPRAFGQSYKSFRSFQNSRSYATYRTFGNTGFSADGLWSRKTGYWIGGITTAGALFYVTHLDRAPVTGRRRFMMVSESLEKYMGERSYRQTLQQFGRYIVPDNHPQARQVQRVVERLVRSNPDLGNLEDWKVHLVHNPSLPPNAFVLPNRRVFVFSSILPICQDDDGLATVLAHETGHQLARHSAEHMSRMPLYTIFCVGIYMLTGIDTINRLIVNMLFELPASREMEREADFAGLMLMSRACYHPEAAVQLWKRMSDYERRSGNGARMPEFMSTHPLSSNRIELIQQWLPEAQSMRAQGDCDTYSQFLPAFHQISRW